MAPASRQIAAMAMPGFNSRNGDMASPVAHNPTLQEHEIMTFSGCRGDCRDAYFLPTRKSLAILQVRSS